MWSKLTILGIKPFQNNKGAPTWICQWVVLYDHKQCLPPDAFVVTTTNLCLNVDIGVLSRHDHIG